MYDPESIAKNVFARKRTGPADTLAPVVELRPDMTHGQIRRAHRKAEKLAKKAAGDAAEAAYPGRRMNREERRRAAALIVSAEKKRLKKVLKTARIEDVVRTPPKPAPDPQQDPAPQQD